MPNSSGAPAPHQVLIVDDDDDTRDAFATLLEIEGFHVAAAWSVEDALRLLRQGCRPCVVLLDLHMPGMDGWAFLDRMRLEPHLRDVPAIIVSGDVQQQHRTRERGCEFLGKPVEARSLIAAIGRHCRRHHG